MKRINLVFDFSEGRSFTKDEAKAYAESLLRIATKRIAKKPRPASDERSKPCQKSEK